MGKRVGPESLSGAYLAQFVIDGERWPFAGTAVMLEQSTKPAYKDLADGSPFRLSMVNPVGPRRAIKRQPFQVQFESMTREWLMRLQNLAESGRAFEVQLLAFDAREFDGVRAQPVTLFYGERDSPTDVAATGSNTGGTLDTHHGYSYRVSAVFATGETVPGPRVRAPFSTVPTSTGSVALSWTPIPGASSYHVYGRMNGIERFLASVAQPGSGAAAFLDDGSLFPAGDPDPTRFTRYSVAGETRWSDVPGDLALMVNGVEMDFALFDHNGVKVKDAATGAALDAANGEIFFQSALCATDQVWISYVWEPKVVVDSIQANARPSQSRGSNPRLDQTLVGSDNPETGQPYAIRQGQTYGVLYSPVVTLFEIKPDLPAPAITF